MSEVGGSGTTPERRAARRFRARHVARLQFVTPLSGLREVAEAQLWPTLICQTRDISESGLSLFVPRLREGDEGFFGVQAPVRVTLGLPTGSVEVGAVAVRYERGDAGPAPGGFIVCLKITEVRGSAAESWGTHLRGCDSP